MTNFKEIVIHGIENAAHKIDEITHKISEHFLPTREKIEVYLKEKNIESTIEVRQGKESFNVLANSDGSFVINNDAALSRLLLNQALFTDNGEKRLSNAMTSEKNPNLQRINAPKKQFQPTKIMQLSANQIV
jgi:hypothetical protein